MHEAVKTQAIIFPADEQVRVADTTVRTPGEGEVRVKVEFSCVSPGTELRIMAGKENGFSGYPVAAGYALAGRIESVGPGVDLKVGTKLVAARSHDESELPRGAHIGYAVFPASSCSAVPVDMGCDEAALARVLSIGHRGARTAAIRAGEQVVVLGLGVIGLSAAISASLTGAKVVCLNRSADRVELARRCGLTAYTTLGNLAEQVARLTDGRGADVFIDATGHPETPVQAIEAVTELSWTDGAIGHARYVILGSHTGPMQVPYHPAFYRELAVLFPRFTDETHIAETLRLIADGKWHVAALLENSVFKPQQAGEVYRKLRDRQPGLLTALFDWR